MSRLLGPRKYLTVFITASNFPSSLFFTISVGNQMSYPSKCILVLSASQSLRLSDCMQNSGFTPKHRTYFLSHIMRATYPAYLTLLYLHLYLSLNYLHGAMKETVLIEHSHPPSSQLNIKEHNAAVA